LPSRTTCLGLARSQSSRLNFPSNMATPRPPKKPNYGAGLYI
jgi:hypothetical protein